MHRELQRLPRRRVAPQTHSGVLPVATKYEIDHLDVAQPSHVMVEVAHNALQHFESSLLRRHTTTHVLNNAVRTGDFDVLLSASSRACRANVLIAVAARSDDGRIAHPARKLPRCATRRGCARHLAFFIHGGDMNRAMRRKQNVLDGSLTQLWLYAEVGGHCQQCFTLQFEFRLWTRRLPASVVRTRSPPVLIRIRLFPKQPHFARGLGEQVLAFIAHPDGKALGSFSY